jgi:hypothetical protein
MSGLWAMDEDWDEDSAPWDGVSSYTDEDDDDSESEGWEEDDDLEEVIPF